ncbi:MAG: hypothetical protein OQJ87_02085, partial [Rhodospirillales bacterium]|nr:hypothetical protein [Rhodospirillales bacterium]
TRAEPKLVYHNDRNASALRSLQKNKMPGMNGDGWRMAGLTRGEFRFRLKTRARVYRRTTGGFCAALHDVQVGLGYETLDVYVVDRYSPGSCEYESILEHEKRHVDVFRRIEAQYVPMIVERIQKKAQQMGALPVAAENIAADRLQDELRRMVTPLLKEMEVMERHENAKLDTPEAYREEQKRCQKW